MTSIPQKAENPRLAYPVVIRVFQCVCDGWFHAILHMSHPHFFTHLHSWIYSHEGMIALIRREPKK